MVAKPKASVNNLTGYDHFAHAMKTVNGAVFRRNMINEHMREMRSVVYVIWFPDEQLVKIGFTRNLRQRLTRLGVRRDQLDRLLYLMPGGEAEEHDLHHRFRASLGRGKEYFHPTPDLMAWVNEQRSAMNLPAVA